MVSQLDQQVYTSDFVSHWVPHSYGIAEKKAYWEGTCGGVIVSKLD